ncbi:MAG: zinc dependent phospholipase C family protein [Deltaproteobacteria bacterium]|nr:zinc dependent phospholipase C family protein [Candidatus Anaeroferrophillus wilburensis]MBN2888059.1 zinc dependent phospholipase C family protein [Deltaproteobacteria bacterium]
MFAFMLLLMVLLVVFGSASPARAWGPATHLELGRELLADKDRLPLPVATLLARYPYDFLYGNIAADMVVGKKFVDPLRHCHIWPVAFQLLEKAVIPAQQAFVYGYLTHLAADLVAHNVFVPTKIVQHYYRRRVLHLYWEMRFEVSVRHQLWQYAHLISRRCRWDHDPLLAENLTPTLFSFPVNRRIFNTILLLNRTRRWQKMLARLDHSPRCQLSAEDVADYKQRCLANMREILQNFQASPLCAEDPRGEQQLLKAKKTARRLRRQKTLLTPGQLEEYLQSFL